MKDENKTRKELISELQELRQHLVRLEKSKIPQHVLHTSKEHHLPPPLEEVLPQPKLFSSEKKIGRFTFLMFFLLTLLVINPFLSFRKTDVLVINLIFTAILFSATYALARNKRVITIAVLSVGIPWFVLEWLKLTSLEGVTDFALARPILSLSFFSMTAVVILFHIMQSRQVTFDTLYGAISVYLLLGVAFADIFIIVENFYPGSFNITFTLEPDKIIGFGDFIFYSFTTLTTLGYGDITPITPQARAFAMLESIVGVFYTAILIGKLVSMVSMGGKD